MSSRLDNIRAETEGPSASGECHLRQTWGFVKLVLESDFKQPSPEGHSCPDQALALFSKKSESLKISSSVRVQSSTFQERTVRIYRIASQFLGYSALKAALNLSKKPDIAFS